MTFAELYQFFDRVTYKPGWEFKVYPHREGPVLTIIAPVPERGGDDTIVLGIDTHLPTPLIHNESDLLEFLLWRLTRVENHEVREFLKLDGQRVFDPHTEGAA